MESNDLSNALQALSLMIGLIAVVFGAWQPEANSALKLAPERNRASRNGQLDAIRSARNKMCMLKRAICLRLPSAEDNRNQTDH